MSEKLTPALLVYGYERGYFPMADEDGEIGWYHPDPRAIIPLDAFHVPKSLAKTVRQGKFDIRFDTAFEQVVRACGDRPETWISEEIVQAYTALHHQGLAHSVEAWQGGRLVGGLYGVSLGGAFMGESMFSRATDASKVCLVHLVERLKMRGFTLLDCQLANAHTQRFGVQEIPRSDYLRRLEDALSRPCGFAP